MQMKSKTTHLVVSVEMFNILARAKA